MNVDIINSNSKIIIEYFCEMLKEQIDAYWLEDDYENTIKTYFKEVFRINDYVIKDNKELKKIYDCIIEEEKKKIIIYLSKYNYEMLKIIFYNLSEYILQIHSQIYSIIYKSNKKNYGIFEYDVNDIRDKKILDIISSIRKDKDGQTIGTSVLAAQKWFIQYFFVFLLDIDDNGNKNFKFDKESFVKIYKSIQIIMHLVQERDFLINLFYRIKKVEIKDGMIEMPKDLLKENYIMVGSMMEDAIKFDNLISDKFSILDKNFNEIYGFSCSDIEKILVMILNQVECRQSLLITVKEKDFINVINNTLKANNAFNIIDYLIHKSNNRYGVDSLNSYEYRLFKTPIIEGSINNENVYYLSVHALIYAIEILKRDIIHNELKKKVPKNTKVIKDINNELVESIFNYIKNKCDFCSSNIDIGPDENNKKYEVDTIAIRNNILYIIECKNVAIEFDADGFKSDMRQVRKHIRNINLKESIIKNNIEKYENEFGCGILQIKKVLVYKRHNAAQELLGEFGQDVKILSESEFYEWFI